MFKTLWLEFRVALVVFLLSLLLGYVSGHMVLFISVGLFLFIFWHLRQIMLLRNWIQSGSPSESTPDLFGSSDQIVSLLYDQKKKNKKKIASLKALLARFDAATKAMPDAILIIDQNQIVEWANPAANNLLGIDLTRDIGQRVDNIVRDPLITNYLANSDFDEPLEFSSVRSSENDLTLRVVVYADGKKLLIVHDHRDLLRLQKVRKAFVSNASHEMRTPLTVIIGYLETLSLKEEMASGVRRGVDGALEQAQRLKQLIEDLLSLSRLESLPLSKSRVEDIDITALVNEGITVLQASKIYQGQQFHSTLKGGVLIEGDYRELQSAIQNILDNAVKYTPANALIDISLTTLNSGVLVLSVHDHGEGIEQSHLSRLTERFYRVDDGRSRGMGGTGLGLSIVKHVMERHGGELHISSEKGSGTRVELHFPAVRVHHQSQQESA